MMSEASTTDYEIAVERVVGFLQQFDRAHFDLACHAAFPLVITPDLLYQIWLRFVPQAPWTAVARVLLSRLCREVGYELYEMDIAVRNLLLADIKDNEEFNKDKPRLEELADFLTTYVTQQFAGDNSHTKNLAQAQCWTALAYTKPDRLSRELLEAIEERLQQKNWKELFRLSSLVETFATPLAEFAPLLITYARGMANFTVGDVESAREQFSKLPIRDRLVDIDGVSLSIPDEVPLTTVGLDFLLRLLQVISDSDGDPQIVYPILQANLDKLDESFSALLRSYVANFVSLEKLEQVQAIVAIIVTFSNLLSDFPLGSRANNLEIAIAGYEIALSNFTFNSFPEEWAMTQNNLGRAFSERIRGERAENLERAIAFYEAALQVRTRQAFPQDWAMTQNNLATAYIDRIKGDRGENIERAIRLLEAASEVYTREAFPQNWAMTQNNLANAYRNRIKGERGENIEKGIAFYEAASQVYTRDAFPQQWAMTLIGLAIAYYSRIKGERGRNIEMAIAFYEGALQVQTHEAFPTQWAMTQNNLGRAFSQRIKGERAENLERAIHYFLAALEIYTRQDFPEGWADIQNNLAVGYTKRIHSKRADNLEEAIGYLQNALEVYTREYFPYNWAETQNNLAAAYRQRIRGKQAENLEQAIACCQNALEVYTRDAFPLDWAETVNNLGFAYRDRIQGERAENLEIAISCFFSALEVYTREAFPQNWANTQSNLGIAYRDRIQGDRAENLEQAINCFMNALQVYTCDAFPQNWAETQNNLGITYLERTGGDRADNLKRAIYSFQNAWQIYTRPSFPQNHLETLFNLALAYQNTHQLTSAYDTFANIIESLESFQVRTFYRLEIPGDQQEFTEQLNKVYQHMVEVCLQLSYTDKAIEYVERSKAHSLVALLANYDIHPKGNIPDSILNELQRLRLEISIEQLRPESKDKNRFLDGETLLDGSLLLGDSSLFPQKGMRLTQLQQQLDELINHEILPIDPNFNLIEPINFAQIQSIIPNERTAILEWYLQDDNFQTFIITQQSDLPSVWQSSVEKGSALIEWTNEYFQDYLENKRQWQEQLSLRLQNLTQILHLDEILNYLPTSCDQLILIPHRFLHCIPLHALPLADGSYLLDRFPGGVRHAPSCQLLQLVQTRQRPEFSHFFAIQDPNNNLPYTNIEVETIMQYFPHADILAKAAATKDALSNKPLSLYHCLHFSSGSHFNTSSPLLSALILADAPMPNAPTNSDPIQYLPLGANGVIDLSKCLTVEEIFKLDLSQCRLVTLSASETALTDWTNGSNEYIGFPGAFLFAGSASVVGSLWGIDDLSTALLMIKFYQNLQIGLTVAVALNQAQLWLRDITKIELEQLINANQLPLNPTFRMKLRHRFYRFRDDRQPFREPFHWAAFCAIGQ